VSWAGGRVRPEQRRKRQPALALAPRLISAPSRCRGRAPAQLKARAQRRANGARCAGVGGAPLTQRTGLWALSRDEGQWCKHERYGSAFARLGHGVRRRSGAERGVTRGGSGAPWAARSAFLHRTALRVLVHGDTAVRAHLCNNSPCGWRAPGLPTCRVFRRGPKGRTQVGTCLFCMGRPTSMNRGFASSAPLAESSVRTSASAGVRLREEKARCVVLEMEKQSAGVMAGEVTAPYGNDDPGLAPGESMRVRAETWKRRGSRRGCPARQAAVCAQGSSLPLTTPPSRRAWTLVAPCRARTRSLQTIVVRTGLLGRTGQRCKAATVWLLTLPFAWRTPFPLFSRVPLSERWHRVQVQAACRWGAQEHRHPALERRLPAQCVPCPSFGSQPDS
jgi:hypothetical protein